LAPGETYSRNSANMWSLASVDEKLGMVYLPLGNQTPDQWGADRTPGAEKFSAGIVALDLATGKVRWNYQFTHHDLWDMDVGSQPTLLDMKTADGVKPALIAPTKQGSLYVLDRRDGTPIIPIKEIPVPQGAVKGDHTAPTQARSDLNLLAPELTEKAMWGASPFDQMLCRIQFKELRYEGQYTPPSEQGSLIYPGNVGVFNWGGVSVDPVRQMLFTSPNYMAFVSKMVPREQVAADSKRESETAGVQPNTGAPYAVIMHPFMSPLGVPCQAPSWGYVAGIDLTTGKVVWKRKNGTSRDSSPIPIGFTLGVPSMGGSMVTAGGVGFLSGTLDQYLRAYDVNSGKELWKSRLPAGGQATPMTYTGKDGKQYVLLVVGGHGSLGTKMGDYIIAYKLPE
jgi:quinoprotein glucose dehydrogenase